MKYLFWNTHKNVNINSILCDLIIENRISVVVLAEYTANTDELIDLLQYSGIHMKQFPTVGCERISILGKIEVDMEPQLQTDHTSIQIINENFIMCCVHLNSQIYTGSAERREIDMEGIISEILKIENELDTKDTIIVGDFNINPYDKSCVDARYFHGIPVYKEAMRGCRSINGKEYHMFYNPMWNFLGDFKEPYGTYYHRTSDVVTTYWDIYDQVIMRPALREKFVDDSLKIITETMTTSLLDRNKHPNHNISDHLPIVFEFKEEHYE